MFQQQQRIQLPTEEPTTKRLSFTRSWSIPCCSNLSIRSQRIQLPDDSDNEEDQQQPVEFIIPPSHHHVTPFNIDFNASTPTGNAFLQHPSSNPQILSRNPFARAEDQPQKTVVVEQEQQLVETAPEVFEQQQQEENVEELADFSQSTASKYENEPDWTEMYQDEDDDHHSIKDIEEPSNTQKTLVQAKETTIIQEEVESLSIVDTQEVESITQTEEETEFINPNEDEEEEEEEEEEKIPQIEEEVLYLLPLPQLSNEIPPTMIHNENSMYGELPLMSASIRGSGSRFSRFSMTEEDFLALKKQEEEEAAAKKRVSLTPIVDEPVREVVEETIKQTEAKETSVQEDPLLSASSKDSDSVTQQRRSYIVTAAAQSILGDKLDDFTEKLAFIKKNIIMSIDSDDEEDEEEADNAEETLKKIALLQKQQQQTSPVVINEDGQQRRPLHRRTSSLMDVAPTLARFMNQISGSVEEKPTTVPAAAAAPSTTSSTSSFSPSSLFSALAGPMPEPSSASKRSGPATTEEEEDEELFDFTKVIEIGKNMKSFSEGFVGNGIRMFNDVATRIKTSVEEEEKKAASAEQEEEDDSSNNWLNDSYI